MKLAALSLLRPAGDPPFTDAQIANNDGRSLVIDTNKERWLFKLQKDRNFDDHVCLFYKISKLTDKKIDKLGMLDKWTYTRINGLKLDEWSVDSKCHLNFLFFCREEEIMEIRTSAASKHKGSLLLHDDMKGKFFVKQLHIKDYGYYEYDCKSQENTFNNFKKQSDPAASFYGYDSKEIKLNRDSYVTKVKGFLVFLFWFCFCLCELRYVCHVSYLKFIGMSVPNLWHRYERCSCILADVLNNFGANVANYQDCIDELNEMWSVVYWCLRFNKYEIWYFYSFVNKESACANRLWKEWLKDKLYFPNNENKHNKIMPMYSGHGHEIVTFLHNYNLSENFYRYIFVSDRLYHVLVKSKYYEHWNTRFNKLIAECKDSQLDNNEIQIQNKIISKIQKVDANFTNDKICFKDEPLTIDTSFAKDGKLYLSKQLLKNESNLLAKCLTLLKIPTAKLLNSFNILN